MIRQMTMNSYVRWDDSQLRLNRAKPKYGGTIEIEFTEINSN